MDLASTVSTLTAQAADAATHIIKGASDYIPDEISRFIRHAYSYFPADLSIEDAAQFILYFAVSTLILGVISRIALGKRSSLNHSLSSAIGIGFVYILTVIVYTFRPLDLDAFLSPLPFVTFSGEYLILLPMADAHFPMLCQQILSLIILSFLVNLLDTLVPKGENIFLWYLLRIVTVGLSMAAHYAVTWAMNTYLPDFLVTYAPIVLLIVLAVMLFSGILSLVLGLVIAVTNPFLGAMYSFFFSNLVGKQLSKAVFSSAILCSVFFLVEYFGYTIISISSAALTAYLPFAVILLALWYLIGHIL